MDRRAAWVLGIVFGGLFLVLFAFLGLLYTAVKSGPSGSRASIRGPRVGVVEVTGPIMDSKKVLEQLRDFRDRDEVKAVVVRIDSPGGAVAPSQEIYDAIRVVRTKKKVVASMGTTAASGGYYIAAAADRIYANPGTLTGSIGVIFQLPNVEGLMRWAGVQMTNITSGRLKDAGSPFRSMSPEERAYFEGVLTDVHQQFILAVAEGRGLTVEEVQPYADGRVFTGRQAREWKLVDTLGGLTEAVAEAGKLGGIKDEHPEVEYPREDKPLLQQLLGNEVRSLAGDALKGGVEALGGAGLQYRLPLLGTH
jgi:protease-4